MGMEQLMHWISEYGYFALFFCLWLGIVGMPIPDEVIVMTGGFVSSLGVLQLVPSFIVTYLGVVSGLSIGYTLGRHYGVGLTKKFQEKEKWRPYLAKSEKLVDKYGKFALILSYFLPVVRHVIPYVVGSHKMKFRHYALYSYSIGLIWTAAFFLVGYQFGTAIPAIASASRNWGYVALGVIVVSIVIYQVIRVYRQKKFMKMSS
ncbi:DedA family protein [Shimazuella sp. AN120528]|uniref:DedA family protein n=1 Tax=Shimazuella soli TaxID=1892854 RepID=UPI001F0CFF03|nr:DedA family protein [Shimazuella soli]MCH5583416.1 DedA family protein [Shimazuella soli]